MPHGAIPFPFGHCRICNDKATGFHYGVATCEGCKGFFKRSIPKGDKYTCFFGGQCNITPFNRNRCKACRFKRCLDNGMAIDAVKMGRIPKVEKERALLVARLQTEGQSNTDTDIDASASNSDLDFNMWSETEDSQNKQESSIMSSTTSRLSSMSERLEVSGPSQSKTAASTSSSSLSGLNLGTNNGVEQTPSVPDSFPLQDSFNSPGFNAPRKEDKKHSQNSWVPNSTPRNSGYSSLRESIPLPASNNMGIGEEIGTFSKLTVSSSTITSHKDHQSHNERCAMPTYGPQENSKAMPSANIQSLFCPPQPQHRPQNTSVPPFALHTDIKVEPESEHHQPVNYADQEMVYCDNPFSQPHRKDMTTVDNNYSYPLANPHQSTPTYSSLMSNTSVESVAYNNTVENISSANKTVGDGNGLSKDPGDELCMRMNESSLVSNYDTYGPRSRMVHRSNEVDRSKTMHHRKKVHRRSSYSPDIIKVLLDQVGEERIKGMKSEIMTSIAKTCGPEEYEATAQLLTSYTGSTEEQIFPPQNLTSHDMKASAGSGADQRNDSGLFNASIPNEDLHPKLQRAQSLPTHTTSLPKVRPTNSTFSQSQYTGSMNTVPGHFYDMERQRCANNTDPFSQRNNVNEPCTLDSSEGVNIVQDMIQSSTSKELSAQDFSDSMQMDTANYSANNVFADGDEESLLTDSGIMDLRLSDKVSMGSNSKKSGSDKDNSSPDSGNVDELTMAEMALSLNISFHKHMAHYERLYENMTHLVANKDILLVHPFTAEGKSQVYSSLITSIPVINKAIIGFAQDVPGFSSLPKADREILIKRGYYDVWMLVNSKLFHDDESYLQFLDGTYYSKQWMETILNPFIVQKIFSFAKKFNSLNLNALEVAILCAIQITAAGLEPLGFENPEGIQQINSHFVDLLVHEVSKQHSSNCSRVLVDIFRLMPDLAELNVLQKDIIANFSTESCPEKVDYCPKSAPMADIPESDLAVLADD